MALATTTAFVLSTTASRTAKQNDLAPSGTGLLRSRRRSRPISHARRLGAQRRFNLGVTIAVVRALRFDRLRRAFMALPM